MILTASEFFDRSSRLADGASMVTRAVQEGVAGERIAMVLKFGEGGVRLQEFDWFTKPRFEPRVGPILGGGVTFVREGYPGQAASYIGRAGGRADYICRVPQAHAFHDLDKATRYLTGAGTALSFLSNGAEQWSSDAGRPFAERTVRAAYSGSVHVGMGYVGGLIGDAAGASAGMWLAGVLASVFSTAGTGAVAGSVVPGLGTAIGAIGGGIAGAYLFSKAFDKAADKIVDYTIDPFSDAAGYLVEEICVTFA